MNDCRKRSMTLRSFKARSFLLEIKGCRGVRRGSWAAPRGGDRGEDGAAARPNLACRLAGASWARRLTRIPGISWSRAGHPLTALPLGIARATTVGTGTLSYSPYVDTPYP